MTNQENVSTPQTACDHAYRLGLEEQKRKLEETEEFLRGERRWTAKLEKSLTDAGVSLPDRDRKSWRIFWRWLKSLFRRHWRCILVMLVIAVIVIAFFPYEQNGTWYWHFRNPLVVLTQNGSSA